MQIKYTYAIYIFFSTIKERYFLAHQERTAQIIIEENEVSDKVISFREATKVGKYKLNKKMDGFFSEIHARFRDFRFKL